MKTLLDISRETLEKVQKLYHIKTKTDAVRFSLEEAIRHKMLEELALELGSFEGFETAKDLKKRKKNDPVRIFCID